MSWDSHDFPGLVTEPEPFGSDWKVYGLGAEDPSLPPDYPDVTLGDHACGAHSCPSEGDLEVESTVDPLADADWPGFGPLNETLAERAALGAPAFVQIHVSAFYTTRGGNNGCPLVQPPNCLDNVLGGSLTFDAVGAEGSFEFGGDETIGVDGVSLDITGVGGTIDNYQYAGMLRRPLDGLSYAGNPTNDASRTLIPWSVFAASPSCTITGTAHHVNRLYQQSAVFGLTPWYLPPPPPDSRRRVWIVGSA